MIEAHHGIGQAVRGIPSSSRPVRGGERLGRLGGRGGVAWAAFLGAVLTAVSARPAEVGPTPPGATPPVPPAEASAGPASAPAGNAGSKSAAVRVPIFVFKDAPMALVTSSLEQKTGDRVQLKGTVAQAKVSLTLQNKTTEEILDYLATEHGWVWWQRPEDGAYELMDPETYQKTVLVQLVVRKTFRPKYRTAQEIASALEGMKTPNIGSIAVDPTTNKVMVTDLPDRIVVMQQVIDEIDIPLYTRFFPIRHAKVADIQSQISPLMSEVGTIQVDERTHQIMVRDLLENIKQMELVIMALDTGPEIRVYDVTNIGMEGEAFQKLVEAITAVVTDESAIKYDFTQGRIYVEDVPEVHDRIERLLQVFDTPTKQILLQAEIVEVALTRALSFGLDVAVSQDSMPQVLDKSVSSAATSFGFVALDAMDFYPFIRSGYGSGLIFQELGQHWVLNLTSLLTDADTKVLLKPRLLVKNQKEATIHVGSNEPILNTFFNGTTTDVNNPYRSVSQSTVSTGLDLVFTPSISNNGLIEMQVSMENSEPFRVDVVSAGQSNSLLGTNEQRAETVLIIPSGETRVLGGFIRHQKNETKSGVPGLRKLPVVGPLFGSYKNDEQDRTLLFFLTPSVVEESPRRDVLAAAQEGYANLVGERRKALGVEEEQTAGTRAKGGAAGLWEGATATSSTLSVPPLAALAAEVPVSQPAVAPSGAAEAKESALRPGSLEGVSAVDETGPLAPSYASSAPASAPEVTLTSEPPPALPGSGSMERVFGERNIVQPKSSYKVYVGGPSGKIQTAAHGPVSPPAAKPGATPGGTPAAGRPTPKPGATPTRTPAGGVRTTPTPTPPQVTPPPITGMPTPPGTPIVIRTTPAGAATPVSGFPPTPTGTPVMPMIPLPTPPPLPTSP